MKIENGSGIGTRRKSGKGALALLIALFASACLLTYAAADRTSDVPAVTVPSNAPGQGEPVSKAQGGQVEQDRQEVKHPPKSIQKKSTGYPSFDYGDNIVRGQIKGAERSIGQSTRGLNENIRRMNDSINRMRYLPKRF